MLSVRIDGREVETTPVSLARLVFDGRVDRHSPSKSPGSAAERSLEQSLDSLHGEALSDELLCRLRSMYTSELPGVDIQGLCERVERLCRWRWTNPHVAARFFWAAAWLNDMLDRLEIAEEFYDAFLQTSSRESHLRLLAYNNRGVLRIRLGRLEGVRDLMRAVVPTPETETDSQPGGLPAACFNLLNLINVALETASLARGVDGELADCFSQLPEDWQATWLGGEMQGPGAEQPPGGDRAEDSKPSLLILRDPTYKRLNVLTSRLAARAGELTGGELPPAPGKLSMVARRLVLWESRSHGEELREDGHDIDVDPLAAGEYDFCAEAASLLLSEDIPSSLASLENPLTRAEQAVREELASIESSLILNQCELVRSRLEVQRRILCSLDRRGRLAGLLARVDAQLERVASLQSQSEQVGLQRACAELISDVERFCRLADPCRAQREHDDLVRRLRHVRSGLSPRNGDEAAVLLDDLTTRLADHMQRLRRLEVRKGIRDPMRYLRRNWPQDWAMPVPEGTYQALAQCHLSDPQCWVEDWAALKEQLDGHQGQHHLRNALAVLQAGQVSWESVDGHLVRALAHKPDLWPAIAPLFGLFCPSSASDSPEAATGIQIAMHAAASRLFDGAPQGTDGSQAAGYDGPIRRAGELLERVFRQMEGRANRCLALWESVAATLSPVLEREDPGVIAQVRGLAERCLDCWPTGTAQLPGRVDPRNPVHMFLESCDKARRLIEAGHWLNARPPRWDEAGECYGGLLDLGLDTRDQLRRVMTGYYLAEWHEKDAPYVQRQVLAGLETWVAGVSQETLRQVRRQNVAKEIARLRAAVSIEWPENGSERGTLAGDSDRCPNDSKGGGRDPQEGKSEI